MRPKNGQDQNWIKEHGEMFDESTTTIKAKKSEEELLRELADLVALEKRDERLGFNPFPSQEDRIHNILANLGYAVA